MGVRKNLIGQKFGRLLVLEYAFIRNREAYWKCVCYCGKTHFVSSYSLTSGNTKSCGCLRREFSKNSLTKINKGRIPINRKAQGESGFTCLYKQYAGAARIRNIYFDKSEEFKAYFRKLTKENCYYCGIEPLQISEIKKSAYSLKGTENSRYIYNGIDRLDSSKEIGYIIENIVPCCKQCNLSKNDYTQEEFFNWISRVYNFRFKNV